jgi:acetylornithine deacetylase
VLTSDEEIGCVGAKFLAAAGAFRSRRLLICEPTRLRPAIAGKGYGLARVRVRGSEAHSAFPEQGASAIAASAMLMQAIEEWASTREGLRNPLFDPPFTTVNIGQVQGGTAKNIVAGECWFLVEWRPVPGEDGAEVAGELQALIEKEMMRRLGCSVQVETLRADPGFAPVQDGSDVLVRAIRHQFDVQPTGIPFGSEAQRFAPLVEEIVVMGPGDMRTAHSDRECVSKQDLDAWTRCVGQLLSSTEL